MAELLISSLEHMDQFAFLMTDLLREQAFPPLFLKGPLGAGKTTLACRIAHFFPGGKTAETGSPTFTICNHYPTRPPILHCDLYHCHEKMPDEILEFMEQKQGQLIVEWAEYFPWLPEERLDISLNVVNDARSFKITGFGDAGFSLTCSLVPLWSAIAGPNAILDRSFQ